MGKHSKRPRRSAKKILVVDLSRLLPGPFCAFLLKELGCRVITVEDGRYPDLLKSIPPFFKKNLGVYYQLLHHGMTTRVIQFSEPRGRAQFTKLIQQADVVIESFRPGKISQLGFDLSSLRKMNPRLIVVSITGYGQTGPNRDRAGHDLNYMAEAGLISQGTMPVIQWADLVGGLFGVMAIQHALHARERTGRGRVIDMSMADSMTFMGLLPLMRAQAEGAMDLLNGSLARYALYRTADDRVMALAALETKFWNRFCDLIGKPAWRDNGGGQYRDQHGGIHRELRELFQSRPAPWWLKLSEDHDICLSLVKTPREVLMDSQGRQRGLFKKVGSWLFPTPPIKR